jgi:hypothetical protein
MINTELVKVELLNNNYAHAEKHSPTDLHPNFEL